MLLQSNIYVVTDRSCYQQSGVFLQKKYFFVVCNSTIPPLVRKMLKHNKIWVVEFVVELGWNFMKFHPRYSGC